ncbi:hypothetical protein PWT90_08954 [Aphanocladium album]|nr:hypothetical protein PWT90_08954 [Aphanocladium album]
MPDSSASSSSQDAKRQSNFSVLSRRHPGHATAEERQPLLRGLDRKENIRPPYAQEDDSDDENYLSCDSFLSSRQASPVSLRKSPAKSASKFPEHSIRVSSRELRGKARPVPSPTFLSTDLGLSATEPQHIPSTLKLGSTVVPEAAALASSGTLTGSTAAAASDTHDTVSRGTQTVALEMCTVETPDATEFCPGCIAARAKADYPIRTRAFLNRLYCSGCEQNHGSLLFSADQRLKNDSTRVCIGYEGHVKVCPHQGISIRDQMNHHYASSEEKGRVLDNCNQTSCAILGELDAKFDFTETGGIFHANWTAEFFVTDERSFKHEVTDQLARLLQQSPELFCPHVQASSKRFCSTASIKPLAFPLIYGYDFEIACYTCQQWVRFKRPGFGEYPTKTKVEGLRTAFAYSPQKQWPSLWNWIAHLDPKSYNMEQDIDSKHILWCDGGNNCATNYGRLRYAALLHDAISPFSALSVSSINGPTGHFVVRQIDHLAAKKEQHAI